MKKPIKLLLLFITISFIIASLSMLYNKSYSGHIRTQNNDLNDLASKQGQEQQHIEEQERLQPPHALTLENMYRKLQKLGESLERLWCDLRKVGSNGGFCLTMNNIFQGGNHIWDVALCQSLETMFGNTSVADFGAGLGLYGKCFLRLQKDTFQFTSRVKQNQFSNMFFNEMGSHINTSRVIKSWDGFDGAGNVDTLSGGFIKYKDLSEEGLWLGRQWDWVISIEVGEHIPHVSEQDFLNNLVKHGCQGIVLTWAIPGQGGHHHVNERPNSYIKDKMAALGLINDIKSETIIREAVEVGYFKNTIMVFRYSVPKYCSR